MRGRAIKRWLFILSVVLVVGALVDLAVPGDDWLRVVIAVAVALTLVFARDWLKARRLDARRRSG